MVKVDFALLRYLEEDDFRVLVALEMAMRNHEVAPVVLVERIARLPRGGARKRLLHLLKLKIIHHESVDFDGYAMKYSAYDFLACRTFSKRGTVVGVGTRVGCGKESDIMTVEDENGNMAIMKLQRLGRASFRTVARNRDYKNGKARRGASWFYLSRLAATKEYTFMKLLFDEGFPVPKPIDHNRHVVVMEAVDGTLLNNVDAFAEPEQAQKVYERCLKLIVKIAEHGLVHGDFNEFNLFVTEDLRVIMIDFPQMVSIDHKNAAELFQRDVDNLAAFFQRRHRINRVFHPTLENDVERVARLDQKVAASGALTKQELRDLDAMMHRESVAAQREAELDAAAAASDEEEEESDGEGEGEEGEGCGEEDLPEAGVDAPSLAALRAAHLAAKGTGDEEARGAVAAAAAAAGESTEEAPAVVAAPAVAAAAPASGTCHADPATADGAKAEEPAPAGSTAGTSRVSAASTATTIRRLLAQRSADNSNLATDGSLNAAHIKERIKRAQAARDNHAFNCNLHRNTQKGRQKRRIQSQVAAAKDTVTDYF